MIMYPPFVLKSQKLEKNLKSFIHTGSEIFIPDPKLLSTTYTLGLIIHLFIPNMNYSNHIQSSKTAVDSERNIHTGSYFIHAGSCFIHTGSEFICLLLTVPRIHLFRIQKYESEAD